MVRPSFRPSVFLDAVETSIPLDMQGLFGEDWISSKTWLLDNFVQDASAVEPIDTHSLYNEYNVAAEDHHVQAIALFGRYGFGKIFNDTFESVRIERDKHIASGNSSYWGISRKSCSSVCLNNSTVNGTVPTDTLPQLKTTGVSSCNLFDSSSDSRSPCMQCKCSISTPVAKRDHWTAFSNESSSRLLSIRSNCIFLGLCEKEKLSRPPQYRSPPSQLRPTRVKHKDPLKIAFILEEEAEEESDTEEYEPDWDRGGERIGNEIVASQQTTSSSSMRGEGRGGQALYRGRESFAALIHAASLARADLQVGASSTSAKKINFVEEEAEEESDTEEFEPDWDSGDERNQILASQQLISSTSMRGEGRGGQALYRGRESFAALIHAASLARADLEVGASSTSASGGVVTKNQAKTALETLTKYVAQK